MINVSLGTPDNIRALPDGSGLMVGLYTVHSEQDPLLSRPLAAVPLARKFVARLQRLVELSAESLHNVYPHVIFEDIIHNVSISHSSFSTHCHCIFILI